MNYQISAFLDTIAWAEIGPDLLAKSDDGFNVIVGSTPARPLLFFSYADHPRRSMIVRLGGRILHSTAAGRYQILARYFDHYKRTLALPDFSPESQDAIAIQLIRECRAISDISNGRFYVAVHKCRSRWASLPGAGYGQPEKRLADLRRVFLQAGGFIA